MPHEEEASTQNSMDDEGGGLEREEPQNSVFNCSRHQLMSVRTIGLGVLRAKGECTWLKEHVKREIDGRRERPSGKAKEQWTSVPNKDSASFFENFWLGVHGSSLVR